MRYFTCNDLTSTYEEGDMQIRRWVARRSIMRRSINDGWKEARNQRVKGERREMTEERKEESRKRIEARRSASSAFSTRKVFRLFHEVAYFRSHPPPTGIIERERERNHTQRTVNRIVRFPEELRNPKKPVRNVLTKMKFCRLFKRFRSDSG